MYVVLKMRKWKCLEFEGAPNLSLYPPEGCPGFLPVFTDRERAVEFAGDERFIKEIEEATE